MVELLSQNPELRDADLVRQLLAGCHEALGSLWTTRHVMARRSRRAFSLLGPMASPRSSRHARRFLLPRGRVFIMTEAIRCRNCNPVRAVRSPGRPP
jgi:hypothetical protein